jgi:type II secretory pathway pseudopilin PulG
MLCLAAFSSAGCSGTKEKSDEQLAEQSAEQSAEKAQAEFQPSALFKAYAGWMPADTIAVGVGEPSLLWKFIYDSFPPAERGGDAHFEAMRQDISQLITSRFGFDPSLADAIIIGGGQKWQVVVLQGDLGGELTKNESFEANGYKAYRFDLPGETFKRGPLQTLWAVPLEEPAGMALFLNKESFAAAAAARAGKADGLAGTAKFEAFKELLKAGDGRQAVVASHLDARYQRMLSAQLPFPSPQAAVVSLGDDLQAQVRGEKKTLDGMQILVENNYGQASSMVREKYEQRESLGAAQAAAAIMGYHLDRSYVEAFRMERSDGVLTVNSALPRGPGGMMIGVGAAVAIPAFLKYIKRSKASEAQSILRKLEGDARAYYVMSDEGQSGDDATCEFPPSATPVPASEPCCDGVGPTGGAKWTPPQATWEQEGWQALGFQLNDPTYFAYQMINESDEDGTDTLILRAFADFEPGGRRHKVEVYIEGRRTEQGTCEAKAYPAVTHNEFE